MFGESNYLFFCEDARNGERADVFGRDMTTGQYFTLVQASPNSALGEHPLNLASSCVNIIGRVALYI